MLSGGQKVDCGGQKIVCGGQKVDCGGQKIVCGGQKVDWGGQKSVCGDQKVDRGGQGRSEGCEVGSRVHIVIGRLIEAGRGGYVVVRRLT